MDAGGRHETPGSEMKNTTIHSSLASQSQRVGTGSPREATERRDGPRRGAVHGVGCTVAAFFLSEQQTWWQAADRVSRKSHCGPWTLQAGTHGRSMPGTRPPTRLPFPRHSSKQPLLQSFRCVAASEIAPVLPCRHLEFWPQNRISQATHLSHEDITLLRRAH